MSYLEKVNDGVCANRLAGCTLHLCSRAQSFFLQSSDNTQVAATGSAAGTGVLFNGVVAKPGSALRESVVRRARTVTNAEHVAIRFFEVQVFLTVGTIQIRDVA